MYQDNTKVQKDKRKVKKIKKIKREDIKNTMKINKTIIVDNKEILHLMICSKIRLPKALISNNNMMMRLNQVMMIKKDDFKNKSMLEKVLGSHKLL